MKRFADFKHKHEKILANPLPREEKKLYTDNNVVNVLVDRDSKNRRILVISMGCKYNIHYIHIIHTIFEYYENSTALKKLI